MVKKNYQKNPQQQQQKKHNFSFRIAILELFWGQTKCEEGPYLACGPLLRRDGDYKPLSHQSLHKMFLLIYFVVHITVLRDDSGFQVTDVVHGGLGDREDGAGTL